MKTLSTAAVAALALSAAAHGATITNGDASLTLIDTIFSGSGGNGTFLTDTGVSDQLFHLGWYYRNLPSGSNRAFSNLDTPVVTTAPGVLTATYTNAGAGVADAGRFNAVFRIRLIDGATPGSAAVYTNLRFTNINSGPRTFNLFNVNDLDILGSAPTQAGNDTATATGQFADFTDSATANTGQTFANADVTRVAQSLGLRSTANSGSGNFAASAGPVTGDVASGYQWTFTLQAGESIELVSAIGLNQAVPTPGALALLGMGGLLAGRRRR